MVCPLRAEHRAHGKPGVAAGDIPGHAIGANLDHRGRATHFTNEEVSRERRCGPGHDDAEKSLLDALDALVMRSFGITY